MRFCDELLWRGGRVHPAWQVALTFSGVVSMAVRPSIKIRGVVNDGTSATLRAKEMDSRKDVIASVFVQTQRRLLNCHIWSGADRVEGAYQSCFI